MTRSRRTACLLVAVVISLCDEAVADPVRDIALEIKRIGEDLRAIRATPSLDQDDRLAAKISFAETRQRFFLVYAILKDQWGVVVSPTDVVNAAEPDLSAAEAARTDVQAGAPASASGSSSLISKGSGPSYFSAAVENGALLKTVSGTTTTFQGNLIGFFDAIGSNGYLSGYSDDRPFTRFLRRISFSFTLRNSSPDAVTPAPGTDSISTQIDQLNRRLEQYSIRSIVGRNRRDPRDESNHTALRKLMDTQGQELLAALDDALEDLQISDEYLAWRTESVQELKSVPLPFLEGTLIKRLNLLSDLANQKVKNFQSAATTAFQAYSTFLSARDTVLENIEKRKLFSVEYVNSREAADTDRSTFRFIGEGQKGRWDLTVNASYTAYNQGGTRSAFAFRDFQLGAEAARPLGNRLLRGQLQGPAPNAVLSFAYLYERLAEAATVSFGGATLPALPGNISIGQVRVTIPVGKSGVKVPLSVSFSNRSELVLEKQVRGHLGFTFTFDALAPVLFK